MGSEATGRLFEPTFNRAVKVEARDDALTSDAGLLLLREIDHRLGALDRLAGELFDPRRPELCRYKLAELLRERVFALAQGYAHQDDLDRLAHDPAMRAAAWDQPGEKVADERLASQPSQSRLIDLLAWQRRALSEALFDVVRSHLLAQGQKHRVRRATVDIDGFPVEVHGHQEGAAYNGYHGAKVYYPLLASFAIDGDYGHQRLGNGFIHAALRRGDASGAEDGAWFSLEAVNRARTIAEHVDVRIDAAFTVPAVMDPLDQNGVRFVGRLRNNQRLDRMAAPHLKRPVGHPPAAGYETIVEMGTHRVDTWDRAYRLVLVVVDRPESGSGLLSFWPDYFWLVTNWSQQTMTGRALLDHYRQRGTCEDRYGEFNETVGVHLPYKHFDENEAQLLLALLAFNFGNLLRGELEKNTGSGWDLRRAQQTVLKAGARLMRGGKRLTFYLAAAAAPAWEIIVAAISRWKLPLRLPPRPRDLVSAPAHAFTHLVYRL